MNNILKYPEAHYVMPILFVHDIYLKIFKELLKDEFKKISIIYGTVRSQWSGGRVSCLELQNLDKVNKYLNKIKKNYNVDFAFTFNNPHIKLATLNDNYSNELLDIAYHNKSYFIVSSEDLYNHIKKRYPNAKMICSVIIPSLKYNKSSVSSDISETDFYNRMLDKYDYIVLRPEYTIENIDNLDKLIKDTSRVEILINQYCQWDCPAAIKHYEMNYLLENKIIFFEEFVKKMTLICPKHKQDKNFKSVYMGEDILNKCLNIGIKNFKLQGRDGYSFDTIFDEFYKSIFNNEIPKEDLRLQTDLICAKLIQENKRLAMNLL